MAEQKRSKIEEEWEEITPEPGRTKPAGVDPAEWLVEKAEQAAAPKPSSRPQPAPAADWLQYVPSPVVGAGKELLRQGMGIAKMATELPPGTFGREELLALAGSREPMVSIARAGRPGQYPRPYTGFEKEFYPELVPKPGGELMGSALMQAYQLLAMGKPTAAMTTKAGELGARLAGRPFAYSGAAGPMRSAIKPSGAQQAFELLTRAGLEAGSAGGLALARQQEDPLSAALWAAALPTAGRVVTGGLRRVLPELPEAIRQIAERLPKKTAPINPRVDLFDLAASTMGLKTVTAWRVLRTLANTPAGRRMGAKSLKAIADHIERGEIDTAASAMGRGLALYGEPFPGREALEATLEQVGALPAPGEAAKPDLSRYKVPTPGGLEKMTPDYRYDANSGGFIPAK